MKLAILIDYANTFINIKKHLQLQDPNDIEQMMLNLVKKVEEIAQAQVVSGEKVIITHKIASILYHPSFGRPGDLLEPAGFRTIRVENDVKTSDMDKMNQSRQDDSQLMEEGLRLVQSGLVDGVLVFSNDGDFVSLGEKVHYLGRLFWVGVYETETQRASARLRKSADKVIPLHELITSSEFGVPIPVTEELLNEYMEEIDGPHICIYHRKQKILTYPVDKQVIEIGRRSNTRYHYPNIDLTDFDTDKIISRQHAKIQRIGNQLLFTIHKECSSGTWRNGIHVNPGEYFFLEPEMRVVLGNSKGFGLIYRT